MNPLDSCARPLRAAVRLMALTVGVAAALASGARAEQGGVGDLLVAPTRVVFEGRERTAEFILINRSAVTATYRISLVHLRMNENGGTQEISTAEPGELFADELIRYSPRQVTLEPNVSQTVRLQLRKPAELAAGEYRSHLLFRAIPASESAASASGGQAADGVSVTMRPVYGVSVPIIVRHGETAATVTLDQLELLPATGPAATPGLRLRINRAGNQSVYGDFTVTWMPTAGQPEAVGLANGVAVYTPNSTRVAIIPLRPAAGRPLTHGRLRVTFAKQSANSEVIAAAEIGVP